MAMYRLHYFPESGNSYKLALMLTLCDQHFEPVWTDFAGGITRTLEWRETVNEMGEIPVLEESGNHLTQTAPILLHLAELYGRFGGRNTKEHFEVLRWLRFVRHWSQLTFGAAAASACSRSSRSSQPCGQSWVRTASCSRAFTRSPVSA
jgi:glutathione S-transferase